MLSTKDCMADKLKIFTTCSVKKEAGTDSYSVSGCLLSCVFWAGFWSAAITKEKFWKWLSVCVVNFSSSFLSSSGYVTKQGSLGGFICSEGALMLDPARRAGSGMTLWKWLCLLGPGFVGLFLGVLFSFISQLRQH